MISIARSHTRRRTSGGYLAILALLLSLQAFGVSAQIEEESLETPELEGSAISAGEARPVPSQVKEDFSRAEELFHSAQRFEAVVLLDRVIGQLGPRSQVGSLGPAETEILAEALAYRAQIQHQRGDLVAAEADLRQLLSARPGHRLGRRGPVDPPVQELFDRLREATIGEIVLSVQPAEAEVLIDGIPVAATGGPLSVAAGRRTVELLHPGYAPQAHSIDVAAGERRTLDVALVRDSAVLHLRTAPAGAEVLLDGVSRGITDATEEYGTPPRRTGSPFSSQLTVDDVELGLRLLEVRKSGYRTYRAELQIAEAIDYPMPPIALEAEAGQVVLLDVPNDATLVVDGEVMRPDNPGSSRPRLSLPPGEHRLTVSAGRTRTFSTRFTLGDRQALEMTVRPLPGLAFLGVLGDAAASPPGLGQNLTATLERAGRWTVLDRAAEARAHFADLGIDAEALRRAVEPNRTATGASIDWAELQRRLDSAIPALVYVFAVPTTGLLATEVDLWVLSAAPGPFQADRLRFSLGSQEELERLQAAFSPSLRLHRPYLGALVIDSAASPHPVVIDVTPGGPAATAGVRVGDLVLAAAGVPVQRHSGFEERLRVAEIGETIALGVQSAGATRALRLTLGSSPSVVGRDVGGLLPALAYSELVLQGERSDSERWLVELNKAVLLATRGHWQEAARLLGEIDAPDAPHGVGRATVDYWLGVALTALGPNLRSAAQEALGRAAAVEGARLEHADGALLAPRAQARLRALIGR